MIAPIFCTKSCKNNISQGEPEIKCRFGGFPKDGERYEERLYVGIDLGTYQSTIASSAGASHTIETIVGRPTLLQETSCRDACLVMMH